MAAGVVVAVGAAGAAGEVATLAAGAKETGDAGSVGVGWGPSAWETLLPSMAIVESRSTAMSGAGIEKAREKESRNMIPRNLTQISKDARPRWI